MKETRESRDILSSLKNLTSQHLVLMNEIMRLKRELVGRPAVSEREREHGHGTNPAMISNNYTNISASTSALTFTPTTTTNTNTTTTTAPTTNMKKRGRGRPRKDAETVSSSLEPTYNFNYQNCQNDDSFDINNDDCSKTLCYVLEGGELFLHNPNNSRLLDIETRTVVGRYNLYLNRIDWL